MLDGRLIIRVRSRCVTLLLLDRGGRGDRTEETEDCEGQTGVRYNSEDRNFHGKYRTLLQGLRLGQWFSLPLERNFQLEISFPDNESFSFKRHIYGGKVVQAD